MNERDEQGLRKWVGLGGWILLPLLAGAFGSLFQPGQWFAELAKPTWNPPSWVFGPVWTTLYILMGVAAWLVWRRGGPIARGALTLFVVQLVFNAAWSWLFFGLQSPGLAFLDIILLWLLIIVTTIAFWRVRMAAGVLLLPYLAWVTFATALNFAIWRMNS
jgi:translocator protein